MAKNKYDYEVIVIGSGAAGSVAAETLARQGKKVAIIEQDEFGGSAPINSELPMQAMLGVAHSFDEARRASVFGLRVNTIGYNYPSISAWKDTVVKRSGAAKLAEHLKNLGVDIFRGRAHFLSSNEISIARRRITSDKFIICTGSRTIIPGIAGLDSVDYLTPESALNLLRPPKSIFIVGAGRTGVQLAELFSIFGSKVYLADAKKRILSREDDEISELSNSIMTRIRGAVVMTSTRVIAVKNEGPAVRVGFLMGEHEKTIKVDKIILAVGSSPSVDIGLENTGVDFDVNGVKTDEYLMTSSQNIFAAGDVLGHHMEAEAAIYEGKIAALNIVKKAKTAVNYNVIPRVIWTNPEIASVGATESDLVRQDMDFKRSIAQNSMITRSNLTNFGVGFTKILTDNKGRLLGVTIAAPHAGESINAAAVAIYAGMTADNLAESVPSYGSWGDAVRLAAAKLK